MTAGARLFLRAAIALACAGTLAVGPTAIVRQSCEADRAVATLAAVSSGPVLTLRTETVRDLEYWLKDYEFIDAWNTTRGAGVTVAVIDTGVDGSVPDLVGAVTGGTDVSGLGAPNGQKPLGADGNHGTLVGSLIAGRGRGSTAGVVGTAPESSILSISVALGGDAGAVNTDDQIAEAVRWAVDNGAKVINMSLTRNSPQWPTSWDAAFKYAFEHDVVIVAAAGNRGSGTAEVGAPATIPGVLAVAGVSRKRQASLNASSQGITIGVSAPSEQLVGVLPGGQYGTWAGTSGAAPIASGLVALVRAAHPELSAANVINRVISTASRKGDSYPSPIYGYGLINARTAVTDSVALVEANPLGDLSEWIRLHRRGESAPLPSEPPRAATAMPIPLPHEGRQAQLDALIPSTQFLTSVGLPLALLFGFATLVSLGVAGATRHFKRLLRR